MKRVEPKGTILATPAPPKRPLSPHVMNYRWGPHMVVSIVHRALGTVMGTVGLVLFLWWLAALAGGPGSYADFLDAFTLESGSLNVLGWVFGVGFSWALFQHMASGVRHFFMDEGANFELGANRMSALLTFVFSVAATIGFWVLLLEKSNG